ncbi:FtsX-like permease family protein [Heliobacterium gestii]|uniref:FtsX-like permease family protein n=1 Tax=Heliomicrobium gestii TaxID=2699 RepID=A0A845LDD0_HELGE|nr:FtsX-like permease family protein [Heliomicrobium gestii]MBM7865292.1 putative ABC transport system permease protein [Heliomicrobium gestii]MZP41553.1 FtsX-like permease family protein [Heliomicrobium gestii]
MTWLQLIIASLVRRPGKSLPILLGFAVCWATLFSLVTLSDGVTEAAKKETANVGTLLQVMPPAASIAFSYAGIPVASGVAISEGDLPPDTLEQLNGAGRLLPKLVTPCRVNGQKALIVGANIDDEVDVKKNWRFSEEAPLAGDLSKSRFLVGSTVAATLQLHAGSPLQITGENGAILNGTVAAVLQEMGTEEDRLIFTDLARLQQWPGKENKLTFVEVLTAQDGVNAAHQLQARLGSSVRVQGETNPGAAASRQEMADSLQRFASLVAVTVLAISSLLLYVTMNSAIHERRGELGLLAALGYRPAFVRQILISEGMLLAGTGAFAGGVSGYGLAFALAPMVIGAGFPLAFPALPWAGGILLALLLGALAALQPAAQAAAMDPVEALR